MEPVTRRVFLGRGLGAAATLGSAGLIGPGLLTACGGGSAPPSTASRAVLRVSGGDYGFPSPFAYVRGPGYWLMSYIYDQLLWKDASGKLLPWVASGYTRSADGLTYTFQLRPDVTWQDGQPLTADDVAFTFDYFQSQKLSPQVFVRPQGVTKATASGPHTVEIVLSAPVVTFLSAIAAALPIIPKHIWSAVPDASKAQDPALLVGSGAYKLERYSRGQGNYLFTANDKYFLGKPFVRRIETHPVNDELTALLAGDIDAASATGPRPDVLKPFKADPAYGILNGPNDFTLALYWNLTRGGALADVRFRQACCLAIDRKDIVQRLLGGDGKPGNPGFLPPNHPFHVDVEQYSFDPARAAKVLDDAGYVKGSNGVRNGPDGKPLAFNLLVVNSPVPPVTDIVVNALKAVGIQLTATPVDQPTIDARTTKADYEMAITNFGGLGGDPDYLRQVYSSKVPKRFQSVEGYVNPRFDALANQQLNTLDEPARRDLISQMQRIVAADVPMLCLYYPTFVHVYRKAVFDQWYYTPGGFGGGVPTVYNKQAFITGHKTGMSVRAAT
ncbi:MAG: ABC transporter substrate-binding protein [Candidatus Dormibacteria bacterium]